MPDGGPIEAGTGRDEQVLDVEVPLDAHPRPFGEPKRQLPSGFLASERSAVNALSGLPLREQVGQLAYRQCVARCQLEALAVFRAAGMAPAQLGPVPPEVMPQVLELPDAQFQELAGASLQIDATARSSMWEDLQRGRPTEIDSLQGEIVALAERHGFTAPANARLITLVHEAEAAAPGTAPGWTGAALLAELAPAH
ncbi:ketopantoate reductase C-terminal domain-containing protein [Kitasatospora sp. NPDC054795]